MTNDKMETLVHNDSVPIYVAVSFQRLMANSKMAVVQ